VRYYFVIVVKLVYRIVSHCCNSYCSSYLCLAQLSDLHQWPLSEYSDSAGEKCLCRRCRFDGEITGHVELQVQGRAADHQTTSQGSKHLLHCSQVRYRNTPSATVYNSE